MLRRVRHAIGRAHLVPGRLFMLYEMNIADDIRIL